MSIIDRIKVTRLELELMKHCANRTLALVDELGEIVEDLEEAYEEKYGKSIDLCEALDMIYKDANDVLDTCDDHLIRRKRNE